MREYLAVSLAHGMQNTNPKMVSIPEAMLDVAREIRDALVRIAEGPPVINQSKTTRAADDAMLALLDVLEEIHTGKLKLPVSAVEDLNRALYALARVGGERP